MRASGKANKIKYKTEKKLVKKTTFPQKICLRLVGISVARKNKSVPLVCVFCPTSSSCPQNIQESGEKKKVKIKAGKKIKLGKTQAKKSLTLLILGLINSEPPVVIPRASVLVSNSTHCLPRNQPSFLIIKKRKPTIIKCKVRIIQVLGLRRVFFKE